MFHRASSPLRFRLAEGLSFTIFLSLSPSLFGLVGFGFLPFSWSWGGSPVFWLFAQVPLVGAGSPWVVEGLPGFFPPRLPLLAAWALPPSLALQNLGLTSSSSWFVSSPPLPGCLFRGGALSTSMQQFVQGKARFALANFAWLLQCSSPSFFNHVSSHPPFARTVAS